MEDQTAAAEGSEEIGSQEQHTAAVEGKRKAEEEKVKKGIRETAYQKV